MTQSEAERNEQNLSTPVSFFLLPMERMLFKHMLPSQNTSKPVVATSG